MTTDDGVGLVGMDAVRARAARAEAEARDLRAELAALKADLLALAEHRALEAFTHEQHLELEAVSADRDELAELVAGLEGELDAARSRIRDLENSTSWRLTAPLRRASAAAKGG